MEEMDSRVESVAMVGEEVYKDVAFSSRMGKFQVPRLCFPSCNIEDERHIWVVRLATIHGELDRSGRVTLNDYSRHSKIPRKLES